MTYFFVNIQTRNGNSLAFDGTHDEATSGNDVSRSEFRGGGIRLSSRGYALASYAAWVAALIAAYYLLNGVPRAAAWGLIGVTGVAAMAVGVIINRPSARTPWLLLAAALASFTAGQASFLVAELRGIQLPFPSYADALYLATYPLYAAGLLIFIRWRAPHRDRRSLIDALTLTVGVALLSWIYLILPFVHNPHLTWLQKSVSIAYPLGDILILAMLARLLAPGPTQTRSVQLLTLGAIGGMASDVAFGLLSLYGSFHDGTIVDLGWAVFYGAWGAAALHPSMAELTQPARRQPAEVSLTRLTLLMGASLIAPVVLFTRSLHHAGEEGMIAVFSAVLYLLVLSRLWDVAASHRRVLSRERALRQASASLLTVLTVEQAGSAISSATQALFGKHPPDGVLLAVRSGDGFRIAADYHDFPPTGPLEELVTAWLPLLTGRGPLLAQVSELPGLTTRLPPGRGWALLCPLTLEDRPSGDTLAGFLGVFSQQRILADLSATLEILAHQAALAVERSMLREELIRQGNEAYFRALVQDASDAILIIGEDGDVRYATPSTASIFGDVPAEGNFLWELVADEDRTEVEQTLGQLRDSATLRYRSVDRKITRRDGVHIEVEVSCSDLRDEPAVAGLVLTIRDVTEQRKLEEELKHRAFHDALTGLPNRLLFQDRVSQQLSLARRSGLTVGVLFVDLDEFKTVNDTMGHGIGDEMLAAVAARLRSLFRDADTAARLGGDEFAVLVPDADGPQAVEAAADRIVEAFSEPFILGSWSVITTATVGVATSQDSINTDELLRHADLALYAAKSAGKRGWRRYQHMLGAGLMKRREMKEAIEEALAQSAFTLAYQPIVTLASGELAGFEALVRWPHPQWGMMQPGQFINLAEETGQIIPLGSWVLAQAAGEAAGWRKARGRDLYVSVNVSARQFSAPDFTEGLRRILDASGIEPDSLMLELTESVLLGRDDRMHNTLAELKSLGVMLAIDDFGTGYSSLSYLRELPIDVLKMDKSFVEGIAVSEQRLALAQGIVQIARTLSLKVVAEGIESEVQRDLLTSMGCHYGQGYLLAMPLTAQEAQTMTRIGLHQAPALPHRAPEPAPPRPVHG